MLKLALLTQTTAFLLKTSNFKCPTEKSLSLIPNSCPSDPKYKAGTDKSSLIAVTPPRHPGPSEQLHAIRDVILASIQTKTRFALNKFTIHKHDTLSKRIDVPFGLRVDIPTLCEYINLEPEKTGTIDSLVYMMKNQQLEGYIKRGTNAYLQNYSNLTVKNDTKIFHMQPFISKLLPTFKNESVKNFFIENKISKKPNVRVRHSKIVIAHAVDWIYGDLTKPIDEGGVYRLNNKNSSKGGLSSVPDMSNEEAKLLGIDLPLLRDVYKMTPHSQFIKDLAKDFMKVHGMKKFIGLHFRFNYEDFFGQEDKMVIGSSRGRKLNTDIFANLLTVLKEPLYLLDRLTAYAKVNLPKGNNLIFLTSPYNIAEKLSEILKSRNGTHNGYQFITTIDTANFLGGYRNCDVIDSWFGEVLSQMEKELMIYSETFLRARPSNWSFNVQAHRFASGKSLKYDRVMTDIFKVDGKIPDVESLKKLPYVKSEWFENKNKL